MADEENKPEGETEEIEVDEKFMGAVAEKVTDSIKEFVNSTIVDTINLAVEKTVKKDIADGDAEGQGASADVEADEEDEGTDEQKMIKRAMRFTRAVTALKGGNMPAVYAYNKEVLAERQKAGYQNEGTDPEGGYLVPDAEFDTTIYENLPRYGVAFQYADIRRTDRNAVKKIALTSDVSFTKTSEAGIGTASKLAFDSETVTLDKYLAFVPATSELDEDSAVAYWNLVTTSIARAQAKVADKIVFTDSISGITNTPGVITEPVASATTIGWDDLLNAENALEDGIDTADYAFYMRRATWNVLIQSKAAADGHYFFQPNPKNPSTPWGTPIRFTRVLAKPSELGANDAYCVFADLRNYQLITKRGLEVEIFNTGTIKDTNNGDFNLLTQDSKVMRARIRLLGILPKGNRGKFVILGTGTVS